MGLLWWRHSKGVCYEREAIVRRTSIRAECTTNVSVNWSAFDSKTPTDLGLLQEEREREQERTGERKVEVRDYFCFCFASPLLSFSLLLCILFLFYSFFAFFAYHSVNEVCNVVCFLVFALPFPETRLFKYALFLSSLPNRSPGRRRFSRMHFVRLDDLTPRRRIPLGQCIASVCISICSVKCITTKQEIFVGWKVAFRRGSSKSYRTAPMRKHFPVWFVVLLRVLQFHIVTLKGACVPDWNRLKQPPPRRNVIVECVRVFVFLGTHTCLLRSKWFWSSSIPVFTWLLFRLEIFFLLLRTKKPFC